MTSKYIYITKTDKYEGLKVFIVFRSILTCYSVKQKVIFPVHDGFGGLIGLLDFVSMFLFSLEKLQADKLSVTERTRCNISNDRA